MPVVYKIAEKSISTLIRKVAENKKFQQGLVGALTPFGLYYGYEKHKNNDPDFPDPLLPSSKPTKKYQEPINPSVKDPIDHLVKKIDENIETSNKNFELIQNEIELRRKDFVKDNNAILERVQDSPFLSHQVLTKDTLDNINQNLEAQTIMMGYLWETLDKNLSSLVAIKSLEAQNAKVLTDYQKTIAAQSDMGQFFYEFIPTSEYWAKADTAQVLFDSRSGWETSQFMLPSVLYASGEIDLIDSLQGYYSNAEIRSKVEDYRRERLGSDIRSLIGQTAVSQAKDQAETNSKAKEYYHTATEALKANDTAKAVTSLASAVAPLADWADKAKVREEFLTTPTTVRDLDGNVVVDNVAPMELIATKDATIAREKTDTINFEVEDSDFPLMDFLPVLPFVGRESVYDPNFSSPSSNPFTHKNIT